MSTHSLYITYKWEKLNITITQWLQRCNDDVWQKYLFKLFLTYKAVTYRLDFLKNTTMKCGSVHTKTWQINVKVIFFSLDDNSSVTSPRL